MSKSCPGTGFIGYRSGGSCTGGKGDKVSPSGLLLPLLSALEHRARLHRHVSRAEGIRQLCHWADSSLQPHCWERAARTCDLHGLSSPQQVCCPWDRAPWHAGYASHAGMVLLKLYCSVYGVIYRQEKIDSATQC